MESPSSSSPSPLNVLLITGLSSCASAFTSPASPRVEVVSFRASLAVLAPFSRCRLSRTPLSALRRSSDAFQTQSTDDDLFVAPDIFDEQNNIENGSRSSSLNQNDFSYEMEDEYAYSQQMQDYSQQTDSQTQVEYPPSSSSSSPWQSNYALSSILELEEETLSSAPSNNNEPISSVDARVLESILQEGKLDLSTEEEVKRLLEGPRLLEKEENSRGGENDDKYSSKFVSTVADNTFWNSLKAKAAEIIESVGIYIENRIERDSQTLAAVGLFTLDRIRRDIGRALPAAGRATRKLLLATNSSYAERLLDVTDRTPFALPAERSLTDREMFGDVYDELSTPADEIRQVTEAILDILSGKRVQSDSSSYLNSRRSVRSFAPAGTSKLAERQRRAYQARKQTVLKREREGIDRKVGRAIGSVTDATWEFRREMQTDAGREAGYRSKGVRNALAAGATRLLEAGRENSRRLLSGNKRSNLLGGDATLWEEIESSIIEVTPAEEEGIIADIIAETNMEYAPDGLLSPRSFFEEKQRLVASLESCLSQPSETWLTKDVVAQATASGIMLDGTILRDVIADMVTLRDEMQKELGEIETGQVDLKMAFVQSDLRRMKQLIDSVVSLAISAAGESAAYLLKQELEGFVLSDSLVDIIDIELERMEHLLAELVASREKTMQSQKQRYFMDSTVQLTGVDDMNNSRRTSARNARRNYDLFTEAEVVSSPDRASFSHEIMMDQDQDAYQASSRVEVLSETEYSGYEQQFKYAQSGASGKEVDIEGVDEENPTLDFVLRLVDVVFFIGEKVFLVLPDVIMASAKLFSRYGDAQNRGMGSVGWKPLKNVKRKHIR